MKNSIRTILTLAIILCHNLLHAQLAPSIQWEKSLGGSEGDAAYSIRQISDDGYIVAGFSASNDGDVSGNQGGSDYWIVKLNNAGELVWQKTFGGIEEEYALSIQQTTDKGFIVAGYSHSSDGDATANHGYNDYWVLKLDSMGNLDWQKSFGGSGDDIAQVVRQTSDEGYVIAGWSYSNDGDVTGNHGFADYWIIKLDNTGELEWQQSLGGSDDDRATSISQIADGGFVVAGWSDSNDGDVTDNHGYNDYWVVKLDSGGNLIWQKSLGGTNDDLAFDIQPTADAGSVCSGLSYSDDGDLSFNHGNADDWIVKLDATGNISWQVSLGGNNYDAAYSVQQIPAGGFIVAGASGSNDGDATNNQGGWDDWILELDTDGNIVWQESIGGSSDDAAYSVALAANAELVVAGYTESNDGDVSVNHGFFDFWIVKLGCEQSTFYADNDNDSFGNSDNTIIACSLPVGYVSDSSDCDDNNVLVHPNAAEICNGIDDNCVNGIDEGLPSNTYYLDADNDGFGNEFVSVLACSPPPDYVTDHTDCDDSNGLIHPGATEICNGLDDNCVNGIDEGLPSNTYYLDADNDGFGNEFVSVLACSPPAGYVTDNTDCDDTNELINPGAVEICNGLDDNCANGIDEGLVFVIYYLDADNDGFGNVFVSVSSCSGPPVGYVVDNTDCDDNNLFIHPGAVEICNNVDDNCVNGIDEGLVFVSYYLDADSDNYGNALVTVSTCSGVPEGYVSDSTDCDDSNSNVNPGAQEITNNGIDDDCDNFIDEFGVGIGEVQSDASFMISPNPVSNYLTVLFPSEMPNAIVEVYDVQGRKMFLPITVSTYKAELNVEDLSDGFYTLHLTDKSTGKSEVGKFVKEK